MDGGLKEKKMNINIEIKGQQAKIVNRHEIVSGIAKLEGIEFIFSNEWDSFTKTAVIYVDEYDKTTAIKLLVENNKIEASQLPSTLFKEDCELFVGIFGDSENGQRITSTVVCQPIKEGTPVDVADEASPDIYNQIINIMSETKALVKEATDKVEINGEYLEKASEKATDAENSANKAKEYLNATEQNKSEVEKLTEQSKKYSESASFSAKSASESASSASISASSASQSALNAEGSATNAGTSATKAAASEKNAKASEESVKKSESNVNQAVTEFEQKRADSIAEINKTTTDSQNAINTLTTNSKKEISDLTETKKTELNRINNDITQNASELKEAIVNAADAKKEEINQKGLEVLASIPEDMGKIQDTTLIKSTESGTEINLTDSSDMNIQELHLFGKSEQKTTKGIQLLDLSGMKSGTGDGLTYTNRGDGSVQVSGTATSQTGNIWFRGKYDTNSEKLTTLLTLEAGKKYYIKDCILFEAATNINTQTEVIEVSAEEYPEGRRITGIRNPRQVVGKTYNEVIYPLIAESSTAVDWEEYTGGTASPNPDYPQGMNCVKNPVIKIAGKNLLDCSNKEFSTKCYINEKANILGRALQNNSELGYCFPVTQGKYNIFASTNFRTAFSREKLDENANGTINVSGVATTKAKATIEAKEDGYIYVCNSTDFYKNEKKLMISKMEANEYEEYKEIQTAQPTCELNGIDDVRDELIVRADGTGTLIQRIYRIKNYIFPLSSAGKDDTAQKTVLYYSRIVGAPIALATNFEQERVMCNKLRWAQHNIWGNAVNDKPYLIEIYSTSESLPPQMVIRVPKDIDVEEFVGSGLDIQYKIKEPIITELSSEEVQKILALHTNKPNTTIWNDQNADMQITYIADTKSYIDNKFKELSDAIVASASEAE